MTTAAPVSHFMMDAPGFNDQMEVTSDHPDATENADDFDIDIDLMQDEDADNDVIVDDALPATEDLEDAHHDADMVDQDAAEEPASTTNAPYEQAQEGYYQPDGTYFENNHSYEAEMVDGFEEEMRSPPQNLEAAIVEEPPKDVSTENIELQPSETYIDENVAEPTKPSEATDNSAVQGDRISNEEKVETNAGQEEVADEEAQTLHQESNAEQQQITNDDDTNTDHLTTNEAKEAVAEVQATAEPEAEDKQENEALDKEETHADAYTNEDNDHEREKQEEHSPEVLSEIPSLPPIKVLYQDNEISLFPPREGDSSEIFFLQDEDVASESLSELFKACREVLGDHIAKGEELILDIDSLDLHLNEESPRTTDLTLYEIVEVYLNLCHNDGVDEPEPLYVALRSKTNFLTRYSNLVATADNGGGISSLHKGDHLDHEDTVGETHDDKVSSPKDESHEEVKPAESEAVGYEVAQEAAVEDEANEEPQEELEEELKPELQEETQDRSQEDDAGEFQEEPLGDYEQGEIEEGEYYEETGQNAELATDHEPQTTYAEPADGDEEPVENLGDGNYDEEIEQSGMHLGEEGSEQVPAAENETQQVPEPTGSEFQDQAPLEAAATTEEVQTGNDDERHDHLADAAASDAGGSHSPSSHTARDEEDQGDFEQGDQAQDETQGEAEDEAQYEAQEEIQDEIQEVQGDEIDLGFDDGSHDPSNENFLAADTGNEQEDTRNEVENPPSPKEDLFEFEDQDYGSPGTLEQASTAQSAAGQEFNFETEATQTHPEGVSVGEETSVEPAPEHPEYQEEHSPVHDDQDQNEISVPGEEGQGDASAGPEEKSGEPYPVEVPSGEYHHDEPQEGATDTAVEGASTSKSDEAEAGVVSSHPEDSEPVEHSTLQPSEEITARTPDPLDGLYEIDEDLFKSPMKNLDNNNATVGATDGNTLADESSVPPVSFSYSHNDNYDSDRIDFDDDEDVDENPSAVAKPEISVDTVDRISPDGAQSGKRSRDDGEEQNQSETDVKRRRSQ